MEPVQQFLTSKVGISCELLFASIIPIKLSTAVDNKLLRLALQVAGVLIAAAGGIVLSSSGVLPPFITNMTRSAVV